MIREEIELKVISHNCLALVKVVLSVYQRSSGAFPDGFKWTTSLLLKIRRKPSVSSCESKCKNPRFNSSTNFLGINVPFSIIELLTRLSIYFNLSLNVTREGKPLYYSESGKLSANLSTASTGNKASRVGKANRSFPSIKIDEASKKPPFASKPATALNLGMRSLNASNSYINSIYFLF